MNLYTIHIIGALAFWIGLIGGTFEAVHWTYNEDHDRPKWRKALGKISIILIIGGLITCAAVKGSY